MSDENVGGLVAKWREEAAGNVSTAYEEGRVAEKLRCAFQLESALSAHGENASVQTPVVDEAIRLLRAYRNAPKFSNDHAAMKRVVSLEDEIDTFLCATPMTGALGATP